LNRARTGYDSVGRMMSKTEVKNIPMARPAIALRELLTDRSRSRVRRVSDAAGA
jgi:hypothetical protein